MKCYICGSLDHLIPQCPKRHESNLVEPEILFTQRNTTCEQDQFFIVDAGATSSIASEFWFHQHCDWLVSLGTKTGSSGYAAADLLPFWKWIHQNAHWGGHREGMPGGKMANVKMPYL